jgi:hypothetical protein
MTFTIGENCHFTLQHNEIDAGDSYGFLSPLDESVREAGVQMVRQVVTPDPADPNQNGSVSLWCYFDVLLADNAIDPDGSPHEYTRAEDYARLLEFLDKKEGLTLTTIVGSILNLGSLGFSADERHLPGYSVIKCQLNNVGYYFPPVDPALLALAVWGSDSITGGPVVIEGVASLNWDAGYWR